MVNLVMLGSTLDVTTSAEEFMYIGPKCYLNTSVRVPILVKCCTNECICYFYNYLYIHVEVGNPFDIHTLIVKPKKTSRSKKTRGQHVCRIST